MWPEDDRERMIKKKNLIEKSIDVFHNTWPRWLRTHDHRERQ